MSGTVNIYCSLNAGLLLTLGSPWLSGHPFDLIDREPLLLRPGLNVLNSTDTKFWRAWLGDHAADAVVLGRHVYEA